MTMMGRKRVRDIPSSRPRPADSQKNDRQEVLARDLDEEEEELTDRSKKSAPLDPPTHHQSSPNVGRRSTATTTLVMGRCVAVTERYEKVARIGQGTYGVVYKARDRWHTMAPAHSSGNRPRPPSTPPTCTSTPHSESKPTPNLSDPSSLPRAHARRWKPPHFHHHKKEHFVALKRCLPHYESTDGFPLTTLREIASLRMCAGHTHIVQLENMAVSKTGVFLVLEYCPHDLSVVMDAHYHRFRKSPFALPQVKTLMQQLLSALQHVHGLHIIHRDIKLSNLLYTDTGLLKLADFGLSRLVPGPLTRSHDPERPPRLDDLDDGYAMTQPVASLWYRPPELLLGVDRYTQAIDLWACGCIMAELLLGRPYLDGRDEADQVSQILASLGPPTRDTLTAYRRLPLFEELMVERASPEDRPRLDPRRPPQHQQSLLPGPSIWDDFSHVHLSVIGLQCLTHLLDYNPAARWTASQALQQSPWWEEDPGASPTTSMPHFSHNSLSIK